MGDGHHRTARHRPGERDHPGGRRPYFRPRLRGEVHPPVTGRPGLGRRLETPQEPARSAHRPGPPTASGEIPVGAARRPRHSRPRHSRQRRRIRRPRRLRRSRDPGRPGRPEHQGHPQHHPRHHPHGEQPPKPGEPRTNSHARRLAVSAPPHHPHPDSCGQTAPAPGRRPSDGCTSAAIRCTSGIPVTIRGQAADRRAPAPVRHRYPPPTPPTTGRRPARPGRSRTLPSSSAGPRPLVKSPAARRFPYTSHATRSAGSTSHAPPPVVGHGSSAAPPGASAARSAEPDRPRPSGRKRLGTFGASGVAVTWPPRTNRA